jgi:hypothetical protein
MFAESSAMVIIKAIFQGFANVGFTGALILSLVMTASIIWYAKRRPVGESLTWGQAMAAATYVSFLMFWFFGVVPHQWLTYAEGQLKMRSDAILAGPGSTGLAKWSPVVISKATVSDFVCVNIYMMGVVAAVAMWAVWQGRGQKTEEIETSSYGRPLVKA